MNRIWVRREDVCREDDLQHKKQNRNWTTDEKYTLMIIISGARMMFAVNSYAAQLSTTILQNTDQLANFADC